ncbi:hypothetical protein [Chromobacterium haemolyticum]|uniref:hypothetical protein n=1 Tax=Chromobacterium haemolyticum TaxID=394935 RepID=UPI00307D3160
MFKITTLAALPAVVSVATAVAAAPLRHTISVEATAPNPVFYVVSEGGWTGQVQRLVWRPDLNQLEPLRGRWLEMLSTFGAIQVRAAADTMLQTRDGEKIALTVRLISPERRCEVFRHAGGADSGDCELLPAVQATAAQRVALEVWPAMPGAGGYRPGLYQGVVSLTFESRL